VIRRGLGDGGPVGRIHSAGSTRATDSEEQGAGIGLAAVADLVDAHHDHLDLDSPGKGSMFTVTAPLLITAEHRPEATTAQADPAPAGAARTVLVVEDERTGGSSRAGCSPGTGRAGGR
jgi:hypothetical protein